jgi:5-hydroxyisourate hydrolase
MGRLSTHVLDTVAGGPAEGVPWALYSIQENVRSELSSGRTNSDGRTDGALLEGAAVVVGTYELIFKVADYFKALGTNVSEPPFLDEIPLRFTIFDSAQNYHVPLLVSPYSYSTYRGS